MWWRVGLVVLGTLLLAWVALLLTLWRKGRKERTEGRFLEALQLLPDVVVLVTRLARDRGVPRGVRLRLWLLGGYLLLPLDLVPDFIPVIGYADDAIVVAWVLRSTVRRSGREAVARNWPGTDDGLAAVERLSGL